MKKLLRHLTNTPAVVALAFLLVGAPSAPIADWLPSSGEAVARWETAAAAGAEGVNQGDSELRLGWFLEIECPEISFRVFGIGGGITFCDAGRHGSCESILTTWTCEVCINWCWEASLFGSSAGHCGFTCYSAVSFIGF